MTDNTEDEQVLVEGFISNLIYKGLSIGAALGFDRGELMGNNTGGMLTLRFER